MFYKYLEQFSEPIWHLDIFSAAIFFGGGIWCWLAAYFVSFRFDRSIKERRFMDALLSAGLIIGGQIILGLVFWFKDSFPMHNTVIKEPLPPITKKELLISSSFYFLLGSYPILNYLDVWKELPWPKIVVSSMVATLIGLIALIYFVTRDMYKKSSSSDSSILPSEAFKQ